MNKVISREYVDKNYVHKDVIRNLLEEVYTDKGVGFELDYDEKPGAIRVLKILLEETKECQ